MPSSLPVHRVAAGLAGDAVGAPGRGARICVIAVPDSATQLELLAYEGNTATAAPRRPVEPGTAHASFWVHDIAALYERFHGVPTLSPPVVQFIGTAQALCERSRRLLARADRGYFAGICSCGVIPAFFISSSQI
jgi:hypothetical protein